MLPRRGRKEDIDIAIHAMLFNHFCATQENGPRPVVSSFRSSSNPCSSFLTIASTLWRRWRFSSPSCSFFLLSSGHPQPKAPSPPPTTQHEQFTTTIFPPSALFSALTHTSDFPRRNQQSPAAPPSTPYSMTIKKLRLSRMPRWTSSPPNNTAGIGYIYLLRLLDAVPSTRCQNQKVSK